MAGLRDLKFDQSQVDTIIAAASDIQLAWCNLPSVDAARYAVKNDPACAAGTGRFTLRQRRTADLDADGTGRTDFAPVLLSGAHLSPEAWITSAKLVSLGDYTDVKVTRDGTSLEWSETDTLPPGDVEKLSVVGATTTWAPGVVHAGGRWAADGLDMSATGFAPPTVDLTWSCQTIAGATPVDQLTRPAGYVLPVSAFGAIGVPQEVIVRPNFSAGWAWLEMRGRPRDATRVRLHLQPTGRHRFSIDLLGIDLVAELWAPTRPASRSASSAARSTGSPSPPFVQGLPAY